ncbi:hypothetical protein Tco_0117231 [Tanacetum coccineum]
MKYLQSPEYLSALGGLAAGIDHGKAERGLTNVASYDPSVEANYHSALSAALRAVNFPLLAQLESYKDASIADIMEDQVVIRETSLSFSLDVANARVQRLKVNVTSQQLSIFDALVPLIKPLSAKNLVGEAGTFGVPVTATTTVLSTTFIQASTIPPVSLADHEASGAGPSTEVPSPSKIVFEKEELGTTPEHTTTS